MDILEKNRDVSTKELAEILGVSVWTIRRDLNSLEERKILARFYGGAQPIARSDETCHLTDRGSFRASASENQNAKKRIGLAVGRLLRPGERVALTGGTTTFEVAKALKRLHFKGEIVTNALDIALELSEEPQIRVVCTGGDVQPRYHTLVGAELRTHVEDELFRRRRNRGLWDFITPRAYRSQPGKRHCARVSGGSFLSHDHGGGRIQTWAGQFCFAQPLLAH